MPAWFRFYNEAIDDRKLKHIARDSGQALITVIGAWSVLMALANNDHERGYLMLTSKAAYDRDDLVDELTDGLDAGTADRLVFDFEELGMLRFDPKAKAYYLPAFAKRQYESDNSTARVQRYRERQEALQAEDCNGDETLQERSSNAPETETEAEQKQNRAETETDSRQQSADVTTAAADGSAYDLLDAFGVDEPNLTACAGYPVSLVQAWIETARAKKGLHNPQGYAVNGIKSGKPPAKARAPDRRRFIQGEYADVVQH